jgi:hypothetical protein
MISLKITNILKRYLLGRKILGRFDQIITVSASIPLEMNVSLGNLSILDPGTTLDEEDQKIISVIKRDSLSKKQYSAILRKDRPGEGADRGTLQLESLALQGGDD